MKKQIKIIIFTLLATLLMTSCGTSNLGDVYVEGSDYQYMFQGTDIFFQQSARGKNGYFFANGHYIYYLDDKMHKLVPLCNKADCLHNKETDKNRYNECNAYINNSIYGGMVGISYCNDYLYYLETDYDKNKQILYRMKEDGSEKQSLYQWEKWTIEQWCIHRDFLYFVEHTYEAGKDGQEDSKTIEKYTLKKLALIGMGKKKPETIYEAPEGLTVYSMGEVMAYGNHVYFMIHGAAVSDTNVITDDNYLDYIYFKHITYNTNTEECKVLALPEEKRSVDISSITFWNGQLILDEYDHNQELNGISNSYISDLTGSNIEIFQKDKNQGEIYISDGKYLYVSNSSLVIRGYEDKQCYRVYDKDMNLVDTLAMPFERADDPAIGAEEGQYIFIQNDDNTGAELKFFDKTTIGTYHGEAYTINKIADWYFSKEDLAEILSMEENK